MHTYVVVEQCIYNRSDSLIIHILLYVGNYPQHWLGIFSLS